MSNYKISESIWPVGEQIYAGDFEIKTRDGEPEFPFSMDILGYSTDKKMGTLELIYRVTTENYKFLLGIGGLGSWPTYMIVVQNHKGHELNSAVWKVKQSPNVIISDNYNSSGNDLIYRVIFTHV